MFCSAQFLHQTLQGEYQQEDRSPLPPQETAVCTPLTLSKPHLSIYILCNDYFANHRLLCASQHELLLLELAQLQTHPLSKHTALGWRRGVGG